MAPDDHTDIRWTAFDGARRLAGGAPGIVALALKAAVDAGARGPLLVFDDATGQGVDIDTRGDDSEVLARLTGAPRKPGRPRLGVTAREVTLLPRHWDWLAAQPGGASVALRKLVEAARLSAADKPRQSRDAAYRFMSAIAGDLPGFEEATRALYAQDRPKFEGLIADWPADLRDHAAALAFPAATGAAASPARPGP